NKGMQAARGEIIGWLDSDDMYASDGALAQVCAAFADHPEADVVYARGAWINEAGAVGASAPFAPDGARVLEALQQGEAFLRPAVFFRRALLARIGPLDTCYQSAFDMDFWLRAASAGARFKALDADVARKRVHRQAFSQLLPGVRAMEAARATRRHCGRASTAWIARAVEADVADAPGAGARAGGDCAPARSRGRRATAHRAGQRAVAGRVRF
ncbi:MAG TPA: glycosyltransferase, partial [Terricaulis sp.]|nr:glycosyltransferase [Terricaulis sp.]